MKVKMLKTAASPERVLHAGESYNLHPDEAAELIKDRAAAPNLDAKKISRVPPQPDPEDVEAPEDEDDDE